MTGLIAQRWGLRREPFFLGIAYAELGLGLSVFAVRETHNHARTEADRHDASATTNDSLSTRDVFVLTSRLWRDAGFAIGALLAGITADAFGLRAAIWTVAAFTAASGIIVMVGMYETRIGEHPQGIDDVAGSDAI